jgi:hypothetical protein
MEPVYDLKVVEVVVAGNRGGLPADWDKEAP